MKKGDYLLFPYDGKEVFRGYYKVEGVCIEAGMAFVSYGSVNKWGNDNEGNLMPIPFEKCKDLEVSHEKPTLPEEIYDEYKVEQAVQTLKEHSKLKKTFLGQFLKDD